MGRPMAEFKDRHERGKASDYAARKRRQVFWRFFIGGIALSGRSCGGTSSADDSDWVVRAPLIAFDGQGASRACKSMVKLEQVGLFHIEFLVLENNWIIKVPYQQHGFSWQSSFEWLRAPCSSQEADHLWKHGSATRALSSCTVSSRRAWRKTIGAIEGRAPGTFQLISHWPITANHDRHTSNGGEKKIPAVALWSSAINRKTGQPFGTPTTISLHASCYSRTCPLRLSPSGWASCTLTGQTRSNRQPSATNAFGGERIHGRKR